MADDKNCPKELPPHVHFESGAVVGVATAEQMDAMGIFREQDECSCVWLIEADGTQRSFNFDAETSRVFSELLSAATRGTGS